MKFLISAIIAAGLAGVMFRTLLRLDSEVRPFYKDMKRLLLCAAGAGAALCFLNPTGPYGFEMLAAYLTVVSFEDARTKNVHDFLHLAAAIPGIFLVAARRPGWPAVSWLPVFWALQMVLFRRLYGMADCFVFSVCALYLAAAGCGLREALLHMLAAFILLAIHQAGRKNINRKGNLKEPVALTPYISIAIWLFV